MDREPQKSSSTGYCGRSWRGFLIRELNKHRVRLGMLPKAPNEFDSILCSEIEESVARLQAKPTPEPQRPLFSPAERNS